MRPTSGQLSEMSANVGFGGKNNENTLGALVAGEMLPAGVGRNYSLRII